MGKMRYFGLLLLCVCSMGCRAADLTAVQANALSQEIYTEALGKIAHAGKLDADPALMAEAGATLARLKAAAVRLGYPVASQTWEVHLTPNPAVSMLSLAGGRFLLGTRFCTQITNTSSLFEAALAHEVAHVLLRHDQQRWAVVIPQRDRGNAIAMADALVSNAQQVSPLYAKTQRDQEYQADLLGAALLAADEVPPLAMAQLLQKIEAQGFNDPADVLHPPIVQRIRRAELTAVILGQQQGRGVRTGRN